MKKTKVEPL